jgi:hypothetical protein
MLRLLQVEVANAMEDDETAPKAAEALMSEIDMIDNEELRLLLASISIPKALLAEYINSSPAVQHDWALRLRIVQQHIVALNNSELASATDWLRSGLSSRR